MADISAQGAGQFSTNITSSQVVAQTHNYEVRGISGGAVSRNQYFIDLEPDLNVQQDTFTIGVAPVAGDDIRLTITDSAGNVSIYAKIVHASEAGNFSKVVNEFVAIINTDDDIVASIDVINVAGNTATVRLTSAKGGVFTAVTSVGSGTMTLGAIVSAIVGDPIANLRRRLFAQFEIAFSIADGVPTWTPLIDIYDAAEVAPAVITTYNLSPVRHSKNIADC
jgi:hypothetical protein